MSRRNDKPRKSVRRRERSRQPKPVVLIVCEDAVTAPEYFHGLRACHDRLRVEIEVHGGAGVPKSVVARAKELSKEAMTWAKNDQGEELTFETVWCVFDRDDFKDVPDAFQMAHANGIRVAFANPSFELWLLLHFREQPGMKHRHEVAKLVEEFVPGYEKSVDITHFIDGYPEAAVRARRLCDTPDDRHPWDRNPYTDVHILTELITAPAPEPEPTD